MLHSPHDTRTIVTRAWASTRGCHSGSPRWSASRSWRAIARRTAAGSGPVRPVVTGQGDIGAFAGIATAAQCQVLDEADRPIRGLYAIGNDAASVMGGNYPGAGITLESALDLARPEPVAARHTARVET